MHSLTDVSKQSTPDAFSQNPRQPSSVPSQPAKSRKQAAAPPHHAIRRAFPRMAQSLRDSHPMRELSLWSARLVSISLLREFSPALRRAAGRVLPVATAAKARAVARQVRGRAAGSVASNVDQSTNFDSNRMYAD